MKKAEKNKKEVAKTTNETNVDVELTENELDTVSGGIRRPNSNPNIDPIGQVLKPSPGPTFPETPQDTNG